MPSRPSGREENTLRPKRLNFAAHVYQHGDSEQPLHLSLSDREYQVFGLIAAGRTITDISDQLALSIKTISTYRSRIPTKLNFKTNADLARYAVQHRIVE